MRALGCGAPEVCTYVLAPCVHMHSPSTGIYHDVERQSQEMLVFTMTFSLIILRSCISIHITINDQLYLIQCIYIIVYVDICK